MHTCRNFSLIILIITTVTCKKRDSDSLGITSESVSAPEEFHVSSEKKYRELNIKGDLRKKFAYLVAERSGYFRDSVCSPTSALLPLGKLALGADGETFRELANAIGLRSRSEVPGHFSNFLSDIKSITGVTLDVASRLYMNVNKKTDIKQKYLEVTTKIFGSCVEPLNFKDKFAVAGVISGWVSQQTHGKIRNIISPADVSNDASIILVNAVYFMGKWDKPFLHTKNAGFNSPQGQKTVTFMVNDAKYKYYRSTSLDAQIVSIPYQKTRCGLLVVLPNRVNGLATLVNQLKLAPELLAHAVRKLKKKKVKVMIPKFHIETQIDLKSMYEKIGVRKVFTESSELDILQGKTKKAMISKAIQKAYIDINEWGTKASAASAIDVQPVMAQGEKISFLADRPFLFYVIAKDLQLFSGTVVSPNHR